MKIASHQPYFFPYIGYFSLIAAVDTFIFFDVSQLNRQGWMTRNRILRPDDDWQYIHARTKYLPVNGMLSDCLLKEGTEWKDKILAQLAHYKKKAPFYKETIELIADLLYQPETHLADFNIKSTVAIARKLNIETTIYRYNDIITKVEKAERGNLWGLSFCKAFGGDTYINAPGGVALYTLDDYINAGIKLGFIQHRLLPYPQNNENFIPGLSIIDVLMYNGFEVTSNLINDFTIAYSLNK